MAPPTTVQDWVLGYVTEHPGLTGKALADARGVQFETLRKTLIKMTEQGTIHAEKRLHGGSCGGLVNIYLPGPDPLGGSRKKERLGNNGGSYSVAGQQAKWYRLTCDGEPDEGYKSDLCKRHSLCEKTFFRHVDKGRFYHDGVWMEITYLRIEPRVIPKHD